mmetsp:Transcript_26750/g.61631  ORF Transcript_26750/g.61631 Transcript_26750/m.61631 type:complete len:208 (-) Transcript_26750:32-655(-)
METVALKALSASACGLSIRLDALCMLRTPEQTATWSSGTGAQGAPQAIVEALHGLFGRHRLHTSLLILLDGLNKHTHITSSIRGGTRVRPFLGNCCESVLLILYTPVDELTFHGYSSHGILDLIEKRLDGIHSSGSSRCVFSMDSKPVAQPGCNHKHNPPHLPGLAATPHFSHGQFPWQTPGHNRPSLRSLAQCAGMSHARNIFICF